MQGVAEMIEKEAVKMQMKEIVTASFSVPSLKRVGIDINRGAHKTKRLFVRPLSWCALSDVFRKHEGNLNESQRL